MRINLALSCNEEPWWCSVAELGGYGNQHRGVFVLSVVFFERYGPTHCSLRWYSICCWLICPSVFIFRISGRSIS